MPAIISASVNRRVDAPNQVLFPRNVAIEDSPVGHLEFALRHEGVNLEVIDAVFEHISADELVEALQSAPNRATIRRACFLWEWLTGQTLSFTATLNAGYVDLFPPDVYVTAAKPTNNQKFRVRNNALGNADFCPVVRRAGVPESPSLAELMEQAKRTLETLTDPVLYERAVNYLYLSETRSSYAIERETPSSDKQERFVQLLRRVGETAPVSEEWLVGLQNAIVRDVYSQEASYRTSQSWLEDGAGRVTFFPPSPKDLRRAMSGWEAFVNDATRCRDALVKTACAAFGFVYLHPFLDGNGRLHRFLIQHVLAPSSPLTGGALVPVSAVILKNIPEYVGVLSGFSRPVTQLWRYQRGEVAPVVVHSPGGRAYRFIDATAEVAFLHRMIRLAVEDEIPVELAWLSGYDRAYQQLDAELDLPNKDLSALIRMIYSNKGVLSENRRKQYSHVPKRILDRVEQVVRETFNQAGADVEDLRISDGGAN
ncbi:Fic family protein [Paraburkholderia sp. HP33-1]|uniref:Fic family protein n=1 Tax=Paraburkholderia sp. HP33-1 TaxID=2883243 RepID=UPI001F486AB2|nr:Fic family protein [Paraburkholderia sp. HP33-1]